MSIFDTLPSVSNRQNLLYTSIASLADTKLNSSVNKQNAAAAVLAASLVGCSIEAIATGLRSFTPPPHRMAEAVVDDVIFMNDSKANSTLRLAAALAGCQQPVVLIAGGRDKRMIIQSCKM